MGSQGEKQGRFPGTSKTYASMLFQIKETIRGKDITIYIAPVERNNYISVEFANKLVIIELNIGQKLDSWDKKHYEVIYN